MPLSYLRIFACLFAAAGCFSCNSGSTPPVVADVPSTDTAAISKGRAFFQQNCTACHNFKQDAIGPSLAGITAVEAPSWIRQFVKNPKAMIDAGDSAARALFNKYHTVMPSFASVNDSQLNYLIAYLNTQHKPGKKDAFDPYAIQDPIPGHIPPSKVQASLQLVGQIPASSSKRPLTRITKMDLPPQSNRIFLLDQRGKLYQWINNKPAVFLDMARWKPHFINQPGLATGFGSFAFHPDFQKNGIFYTTHTEAPGSGRADFSYPDSIKVTLQWVLCEWKAKLPLSDTFSGTCRELMRVNMVSGIHGVQDITFNPLARPGDEDYKLLYMGVGDGGSTENGYPFLAHSTSRIWGTVLRIDPSGHNSRNGNYGIPSSNPFVKNADPETVKEIYAFGFRNPNRFAWLSKHQVLVTNIGQAHIEAIYLLQKGHDYGWPIREGNFVIHPDGNINNVYPLPANDSSFHITYPVAEFDHDEGHSIQGGFLYEGQAVTGLRGKYIFGDITSGRLFFINTRNLKPGQMAPIEEWFLTSNGHRITLHELTHSDRVDLRFGQDHHNNLYIFTKADGKMYRVL